MTTSLVEERLNEYLSTIDPIDALEAPDPEAWIFEQDDEDEDEWLERLLNYE